MKLLMVGFGNVGRAVAEMLEEGAVPDAELIGAVTRSRPLRGLTPEQAVEGLEYDALVELSALSVEQRGEPAAGFVRCALGRGRHVVTANKGPMAFAGRELMELARERGCWLLCESAVMDGAPVFSLARYGLRGCRVRSFSGILNSTTNFLLSRMERGGDFQEALREARRRGFAEADASHDLQGWDAACKVCVLANGLMGARLDPGRVRREALDASAGPAAREAARKGKSLRLICRGWIEGGSARGEVAFRVLEASHRFAHVRGTGNVLRLQTDRMAPIEIAQDSPGLRDTAYGVINDLLTVRATTVAGR